MACEIWKNRSWFRKFYRNTEKSFNFNHGFYPEAYFRQKLVQERRRVERSSKPLVIIIINMDTIGVILTEVEVDCVEG